MSGTWTTSRINALEASVCQHVQKERKAPDADGNNQEQQQPRILIDWDAVASDIGGGVTAADCQRAFLDPPPTEDEDLKVAASTSSTKKMLSQVLDGVRPEVLKATIEASLQSTQNITEARKASFIAALASSAAEKGAAAESDIESTLMDIIDQRVQRLENRVALLDDVEALLEAERVALELERRDMYTTRCRHWFGDGSS